VTLLGPRRLRTLRCVRWVVNLSATACSNSALQACQIAFANNENKLCFSPLPSEDVAFPILQGTLHVCSGLVVLRQDMRIETVSVRRLYINIVRGDENPRHAVLLGWFLCQPEARSENHDG